jgi:outer membrane protein TolC
MKPIVLLTLIAAALNAETITLKDALERAQRYGGQVQSATFAARIAHEDAVQAKAGLLPQISGLNQFIYTEGNGTASGVYVANDGVHVYNEQLQFHQDLLNVYRRADVRRAKAAEAAALAKRTVAVRGLRTTVVQDFYAVAVAQRKAISASVALQDAEHFLDITQKQEKGGEAAHADVIKAQLQRDQRQRDSSDAQVAVEKAKVTLGVLIFPDVTRDFDVVDDLESAPALESLDQFRSEASVSSPDLQVAQSGVLQAREEANVARYQYLPNFSIDFFYGIDANQFAAQTNYPTPESGRSTLPDYLVNNRQNLGYSGQVTLTIPLWNWGATRSKVKQAELRTEQAQSDLTVAEKQLHANIASGYLEAHAAHDQIASLRSTVDLAQESLRLTLLRYEAGEATVLEVVDAQTTAVAARNGYADGLLRYRLAVAELETMTGR